MLLARRAAMPISSNMRSEHSTGAMARMGGLDSCQESAESTVSTTGLISNLVAGSVLHHPASLGRLRSDRCRSWTKAPATPPGPPFKYLYEHHAAQSTSQSCR